MKTALDIARELAFEIEEIGIAPGKKCYVGRIHGYPGFVSEGASVAEVENALRAEFEDTLENHPDELDMFR